MMLDAAATVVTLAVDSIAIATVVVAVVESVVVVAVAVAVAAAVVLHIASIVAMGIAASTDFIAAPLARAT